MSTIAFQITATGTARTFPNNPVTNSVTVTAKSTNTANFALGVDSTVTTSTGYILEKGQSVKLDLRGGNTNSVYVIGTASDVISVVGS